jgi:hypothetical protein
MKINAEQRIRMMIGDLVIQTEIMRDQIDGLQSQLEASSASSATAPAATPTTSVPVAPVEPAAPPEA